MESSRKRKAANASSPPAADGGASKRLRLLNSNAAPGSKQNAVQEVGNRLLQQLRTQTDKTGRPISTEFLTLPDEDELPEYYDFIRLPLAFDTIQDKLKRDEYPTVTTLESDLRRLVQNAKDFNDPDSQIYEDAERIRKLVFNFMKQNNPAYKDESGYSGFPTPLPPRDAPAAAVNGIKEQSADPQAASRQASEKPKRATTEQSDRKSSQAPSATDDNDEESGDLDFTSKTFQQAQQMITTHLINYTDEEGLEIYSPFGNLPSRQLTDYYKLIRHPMSLKLVLKRTKGIHGRAPPTGQTDFKSWDAFENEMSFVWANAKEYNEDDSDMYKLAEEFEKHFKMILAEAKEKVDEPSGPRIKIGVPKPKVTLNLAQSKAEPPPGVTVDNEALARQRLLVQAGANGPLSQNAVNGLTRTASDGPRPSSSHRSGSPLGPTIKSEHTSTQSPAPVSAQPLPGSLTQPYTNGMLPPSIARPPSGSPFSSHPVNSYHYTAPALLPPTQIRPYSLEDALLPAVTINSHPNLKVARPFSMTVTPHATLSQQSATTTLPSSHYFLQISATIGRDLSKGRPYKVFVSVNGTRLTQRDTQLNTENMRRTHVYEGSLAQGVNRIEVELAAARPTDDKGLDVEKVTVFANLTR